MSNNHSSTFRQKCNDVINQAKTNNQLLQSILDRLGPAPASPVQSPPPSANQLASWYSLSLPPIQHPTHQVHPKVLEKVAVDVTRRVQLVRLKQAMQQLAVDVPTTTQPVYIRSPTPPSLSGTSLSRQYNRSSQLMSPVPTKPTLTTPIIYTVPDAAPRDKSFSYACRCCKETNHWTKDCPHCFDVRYLSRDALWKVLDDKRKAEGLPPLGLLRGKDNATRVKATPPLPDSQTSPTLSTYSSKEDPCCTSDPLGSAPTKASAPSRSSLKGREILRLTSLLPIFGPHLAHHVPTLRLVDPPYIPPNIQTHQSISIMVEPS